MSRIAPIDGWDTCRLKPDRELRARKPKRERGRQEDPAHLALVRRCPCIVTGITVGVEAAHIRMSARGGGKVNPGIGQKPSDRWVLPLCADAHREQHSGREQDFWDRHDIDPLRTAERLYDLSEALRGLKMKDDDIVQAMTALVLKARANLGT